MEDSTFYLKCCCIDFLIYNIPCATLILYTNKYNIYHPRNIFMFFTGAFPLTSRHTWDDEKEKSSYFLPFLVFHSFFFLVSMFYINKIYFINPETPTNTLPSIFNPSYQLCTSATLICQTNLLNNIFIIFF